MKKYIKPVTEIEKGWVMDGPILAGTQTPSGGTLDKREGLPIYGGSLRDPSFGTSGSFSRFSTWEEDINPDE